VAVLLLLLLMVVLLRHLARTLLSVFFQTLLRTRE
jgi:hypothetical protein